MTTFTRKTTMAGIVLMLTCLCSVGITAQGRSTSRGDNLRTASAVSAATATVRHSTTAATRGSEVSRPTTISDMRTGNTVTYAGNSRKDKDKLSRPSYGYDSYKDNKKDNKEYKKARKDYEKDRKKYEKERNKEYDKARKDYEKALKKSYKGNGHGAVTRRPSSWKSPLAPPARRYRPSDYRVERPVIINNYSPLRTAPSITAILGLSFGTSYSSSLDFLFNRGYELDGYNNRRVYLRNVRELSFSWPDVIFNYSSRQLLDDAEFHYSTGYGDHSRFDRVYDTLCRRYGRPMKSKTKGNKWSAVWYGSDRRGYVTLEYYRKSGRYYTSLYYGR